MDQPVDQLVEWIWVLWVIAVLSTLTVIHRMRYTWTRTQDPPAAAAAKAEQAA